MKLLLPLIALAFASVGYAAEKEEILTICRHFYRDSRPDGTSVHEKQRARAKSQGLDDAYISDTVERKKYLYSISNDILKETTWTAEEFATQQNFPLKSNSAGFTFLIVKISSSKYPIVIDVGYGSCFGQYAYLDKDMSTGKLKIRTGGVKCCF